MLEGALPGIREMIHPSCSHGIQPRGGEYPVCACHEL